MTRSSTRQTRPSATSCARLPSLRLMLGLSASSIALLAGAGEAFAQDALPMGGEVVSGSVSLAPAAAGALTITQSSANAVVNWQTFDIGTDNTVTFVQPDAGSAILNRVTGQTTSTIAGKLTANGAVYLINPNGIQITQSGTITVGRGFVASTLDVADDAFMVGSGALTGNRGSVSNAGTITTGTGGFVGLLGNSVDHSGVIVAPAGRVVIGAASRATFDLNGNGFLAVALPDTALVSADGALAMLPADQARAAVREIVNLPAGSEATTVAGRDGNVVLGAARPGHVSLTGSVNVDNADGSAGSILALGHTLYADGILSAVATRAAGDGGTVETSGAAVDYAGLTVDTRAAQGRTGTWLIDPTDLTVDAAAAQTISTNLATTSVVLQTFSDGTTSGPGVTSDGMGDLTIAAPITWTSGNQLQLIAHHDIAINAAITGTNGKLRVGSENQVTATADVRVGSFIFDGGNWIQNSASLPVFQTAAYSGILGGTFLRARAVMARQRTRG